MPRPGREHDDRQPRRLRIGPDRSKEVEPVELGHHHIGEDQVRPRALDRRQRRLAIGDGLHIKVPGQDAPQVAPHLGVVVNDEHAAAGGTSGDGTSEAGVVGPVVRRRPALGLGEERLRRRRG